jgi:hypothetical protein
MGSGPSHRTAPPSTVNPATPRPEETTQPSPTGTRTHQPQPEAANIMVADNHPTPEQPALDNTLQTGATQNIDALWDRILGLAGRTLALGWPAESRTLATLILHFDRLQTEGWPYPTHWIQPIPDVIDVPVDGDLL